MFLRNFCLILFFSLICIVVCAQKDSTKHRQLLVFPVIAKSIETGWSFGSAGAYTFRVSKKDTLSRTSNFEALVLYTTKKQLVTAFLGTQYFKKEQYILNEQFSYSSFPDKFWGMGPESQDASEEAYKFQQFYTFLHLLRKVAPHLFVGLIFETQRVWDLEYEAGGLFDLEKVKGKEGYQVTGLGGSISFDSRNNAFAPTKGLFSQLSFNHFGSFWGSDYVYSNVQVDMRKFIPVSKKSVFALQFYGMFNSGDVPIRSTAGLGGAEKMRGYYEGRYRDLNLLLLQAEFRFPLFKRFSAAAFGSAGDVSPSLSRFSANTFKYAYGGGLRIALNKKEKLNLRLDYGIGKGVNHGFYLQLGEAF